MLRNLLVWKREALKSWLFWTQKTFLPMEIIQWQLDSQGDVTEPLKCSAISAIQGLVTGAWIFHIGERWWARKVRVILKWILIAHFLCARHRTGPQKPHGEETRQGSCPPKTCRTDVNKIVIKYDKSNEGKEKNASRNGLCLFCPSLYFCC